MPLSRHVASLGSLVALALDLSLCSAHAQAQCSTWSPGLANSAPEFVSGYAEEALVFDDGGGELWYRCGNGPGTGNFAHGYISRWNAGRWEIFYDTGVGFDRNLERLGGGLIGGVPHLFVTQFRLGGAMRGVLEWNGATWTEIGICNGSVTGLYVLDDGSGPALFVAGAFTQVNGIPIRNVAKWTGASWVSFGSGPSIATRALTFADTGAGVQLHAGAIAPGAGVTSVERFDGATWTPVGAIQSSVGAFAHYDSGVGPELYAGTAQGLQRWNGSGWTLVGGTVQDSRELTVADLGAGERLFVLGQYNSIGGVSAQRIASWDGSMFAPLGAGLDASGVQLIDSIDLLHENGAPLLVAYGNFTLAGGRIAERIARWDGTDWSPFGRGFNGTLNALTHCDLGGGEALYAIGPYSRVGGAVPTPPLVNSIGTVARWDGTSWAGIGNFGGFVYALACADAGGTGAKLYVGGIFDTAPYADIAAFDGANWSNVGGGLHGDCYALIEHDDGSGPRLFAGGSFTTSAGGPGNRIAAWNGSSWANIGGATNDIVSAFAVHDEGSGPKLFAAGLFTLTGPSIVTKRIARWDGTNWTSLGSGAANGIGDGGVNALCSFGGELYAGGTFTLAGGVPVSHLARWNGSAWSDVPGGGANGAVLALSVHDDGRGTALYAGGGFSSIGGITAYNLARFDGASWEPVDGGIDGVVNTLASVDDDGDGDAELFAGGSFWRTATVASGNIARLEGCPHYASFCFGDGSLADHTTPCPCGNDGAAGHGCASGANANGALLEASGSTQNDDVVLAGSGFPSNAYGLYLQHDAQDDRVFHDGVLCAGGNLLRLRNRNASGGASQFPDPSFAQDATTTLSQRGFVTPGSGATRYYSVFYRSPAATFCPPATANVTNGVRILW